MKQNDKNTKRLYKRINVLEERYVALAEAMAEIVEKQALKLDEIEEFLEIDG